MGMTMTQKIIAAHSGRKSVVPGELVEAKLDLVLGNDITAPVAMKVFENAGFTGVFDKDKIVIVLDHYTPCKDIASAELCAAARRFCSKYGITHLYDAGESGIEHALLPEKGMAAPGELIIGADSHTCTYGALGAFSTGVGSTDMAAGMASGENWFRVPSAIRVELLGEKAEFITGKDVILYLIGLIGVDGALYKSLEFCGEGVASLSIDDRFTITNMAIEAGAKNGIFPVDHVTEEYLKGRVDRKWTAYLPDEDAEYERTVTIDLGRLRPVVALPHLPENTAFIDEVEGIRIDQAVIGSCTNGRISDMRIAASVFKGRKVAPGVRCIIIPATQEISLQCIKEGLAQIFIEAGCVFSTPTCGPCLGGHMGCLAEGERAVSTTNRNFVGRMGHKKSEVILASPYVAAWSAVKGVLSAPEKA